MAETPDSHDLDKLTKWHDGLNSRPVDGFPVCALFLTSGEDTFAHDIFRVYRTAFEELGAGFHDLVIFGQHGLSSSCAALLSGLGLSSLQIPSLVLITGAGQPVCHTTALPRGAVSEGESEPGSKSAVEDDETAWNKALEIIRESVRDGAPPLLDNVIGLERRDFPIGVLADTVERVKQQVERA